MTSMVKSGYLKNHLAMAPQNFSFSNNAESRPKGQDQSKEIVAKLIGDGENYKVT